MFRSISTRSLILLASGVFATIRMVSLASADPPCFRGLGDLPGGIFFSRAYAVSADGRVVVGDSNSDASGLEAFRWEWGTMSSLGTLPDGQVAESANGVSADGSVIVGGDVYRVFRWQDGAFTHLEWIFPRSDSAYPLFATSVSDDGMVTVGYGYTRRVQWRLTAAVWWNGFAAGLTDDTASSRAYDVSADGLVIVGNYGAEACYWHHGTTTGIGTLPGGGGSWAKAVTPDGSVIVGQSASENGGEAFRWEDGAMSGLGDLPGGNFASAAEDVSGNGAVVVGWGKSDLDDEAFIWDADSGMRNLREVLEDDFGLDLTGWVLSEAQGISADETIVVGWGPNPSGDIEGWIARLPPEGGTCPGDLDYDGDVDLADLSLLLASYGQDAGGDLDCDCATGLSDLSLLLANYGTTCE